MNRKQRREAGASGGRAAFVQIFNQGLALQQAGRLDEAAVYYRKCMALNPTEAMVHNNFSVLLYSQGKFAEAEAMQRTAIKLDPNNDMAFNNLGVTLNAGHRHEEAIPFFRRAIQIEPTNSRATNNLGDSLTKTGKFQEGYEMLQRAVKLDPAYAEAFSNTGMALWGMGRLDDSIAAIKHALNLQPDLAMARKNLGIVTLMKGDYANGWKAYEYRTHVDRPLPRDYLIPRWEGQDLGEKILLVWSEQGVGDEILYSSMAADLTARGVKTLWECDPRLVALFQRSNPLMKVFARTIPPVLQFGAEVVAHTPCGSLGQIFRDDIAKFPRERQSYLKADSARAEALRASFNLAPGEKLVGISWLSKNVAFGENKSTTLAEWAEVLRTPGVRFVDLQYGNTAKERAELKEKHGIELAHVEGLDLRDDLDGLAALISACDLVVTVSNTTAHIAGGLGVPTWVLVAVGVGKFWYWGFNTDTTPWYPSISIVRQSVQQDWRPTMTQVSERLRAFTNA